MFNYSRKDNLTDLVQLLQKPQASEPKTPPGTVLAADGSVVTLGQESEETIAIFSPQEGPNQD